MDEIKQKIEDYLASHNLLSFATADEKGNPFVRSVEYVSDGPN
ncbi:MAG: pyridoxamine 5'-phosphate oxidase family protein, partial [Bacteroidetes bacterium]|nr:pyridoxamine 5'-phosphate oxidase family protein [Bacteroidota bacterium]